MSPRAVIGCFACAAMLCTPAAAPAYSERSVGTPEQIAWVRRAAANFVAAELAGNGAGACAVLDARLRTTVNHRTCAQRWNTRLARLLHEHGARRSLLAERRATAGARVVVRGDLATIELPAPLIGPRNSFAWTENCWMLEG